jgi:hypothetical protein
MRITTSKNLAPSDSTTDDFGWFMVTDVAGSVVYEQRGGNTVTLANVPVGVWMPVGSAFRIRTASTAVGFIVA